jgi:hypothetical protein
MEKYMHKWHFIGLDLGQTTDYTALAVVERNWKDLGKDPIYALRHLKRFPLGTPYTEIVPAVARLTANKQLVGNATLVVDQTGVGRPLVEMLRRAPLHCMTIPVTITGGHEMTREADGSFHVPKKDLVTCLQLLLQCRRLKMASGLREAETFIRELADFRVRITAAANETFGAIDRQHDDLVIAVALACWYSERTPRSPPEVKEKRENTSVFAKAPFGVFLTPFP